jgi:outer membrane lipoprotein SlyB
MAVYTSPTRILLLLSLSPFISIVKSQEPRLVPGDHIRLHHTSTCCAAVVAGTLVSVSSDSISFRDARSGEVVALPRASILGVDRRVEVGDRKADGASMGLIAGAALGGLLGSRGTHAHIDNQSSKGGGAFAGGILGALAGLLVGMEIGSRVSWEQWRPTVLPVSVSLMPSRHVPPGVPSAVGY